MHQQHMYYKLNHIIKARFLSSFDIELVTFWTQLYESFHGIYLNLCNVENNNVISFLSNFNQTSFGLIFNAK